MLARWLMDQRERTVLGEETASAPAPLKTRGVVRPITFWGSYRSAARFPYANLTFRPRAARFRVF